MQMFSAKTVNKDGRHDSFPKSEFSWYTLSFLILPLDGGKIENSQILLIVALKSNLRFKSHCFYFL